MIKVSKVCVAHHCPFVPGIHGVDGLMEFRATFFLDIVCIDLDIRIAIDMGPFRRLLDYYFWKPFLKAVFWGFGNTSAKRTSCSAQVWDKIAYAGMSLPSCSSRTCKKLSSSFTSVLRSRMIGREVSGHLGTNALCRWAERPAESDSEEHSLCEQTAFPEGVQGVTVGLPSFRLVSTPLIGPERLLGC